MNVLAEILQWSESRPIWQRDALRRLVSKGELSDSDIEELTELAKARHGLSPPQAPESLQARHLPSSDPSATPVLVSALEHLSGVNALVAGQSLEFGAGLTVVFGANAAGKSGYTRILKHACRARGTKAVLGNVLTESAPLRPQAQIRYRVGEEEHSFRWSDGTEGPPALGRVSVFDRYCAAVYLSRKTDVAFRPFGLDLFDALARTCTRVKQRLEGERRQLASASVPLPRVPEETEVYGLLSNISSLTDIDRLRQLATWTAEDEARLGTLRSQLAELQGEDPVRAASALSLRASRLRRLAQDLRVATDTLAQEKIDALLAAHDSMRDAQRDAETLRRETLAAGLLPGTGTTDWKALWNAAEVFSRRMAYVWASPDFPDTFGSPIMGSEVKHGVTTAVQSRVQD